MSESGLQVFDKTLHTTHIWLDDVMADLGQDRQVAWHALGAVLRTLRDRLPLPLTAHLGAQLPLLVRGAYYDRWQPEVQPDTIRSREEFLQRIEDELAKTNSDVDVTEAVRCIFHALSQHVDPGQIEKVKQALPADIQALW
ncbi:DUF2267 domain-containing protein [Halomonas shantousis]